jgi:hypothetical protein
MTLLEMTIVEKLEMTIVEKFNFSDGRTVFAVLTDDEQMKIPSCSYDLLVNNKKITEVMIDGEMIVESRGKSPYKAITTLDSLKLNHIPFESGKWKLRVNKK